MPSRGAVAFLLGLSLALSGCAHVKPLPAGQALTPQERRKAIRRAAVWSPTDIPSLDLEVGPDAAGAFASNAWLDCKYKEKDLSDHSPKFVCETSPGQLYGSYTLETPVGTSRLSLGVNNVMNQTPAKVYNGFLASSDASTYDFLGRYVYARFVQQF